jgi:tryptophanyl-tRNA synthetase
MSQEAQVEIKVEETKVQEDEVTPWKVCATSTGGIDYYKLINKFGCDPIDGKLIKRFEEVTRVKAHPWLRRGLFFSNKDLNKILDQFTERKPIYIYTGRGPSSESMHLGHLLPFIFTKYLQDALGAVVIIQMSDDEKFAFKSSSEGKSVEHYNRLAYQNAIDIIACGFDLDKTYIFSNYRQFGRELYQNVVRINQATTGNQIRGIYGLNLNNNMGELSWPSFQCAPAYSSSFPDIFHKDGKYSQVYPDGTRDYIGEQIYCLVPMAIDQDPYFRMARDFAEKYKSEGYIKPATIHTKFLVGLGGIKEKMSSTQSSAPTLYLTDSVDVIKNNIIKHAFSGGKDTKALHQKFGGNLYTDVAYQYLLYFMNSDEELGRIAHEYRTGRMMSGEIKKIMAEVIGKVIQEHQERVSKVTPELVKQFFTRDREFNMIVPEREEIELESDEVYSKYGINFDITFGAVAPEGALEYEAEQLRLMDEQSKKA